ncbi:MAG TPA: alpha/beta family hydrolase, partial [Baekduia sp.]|nr:alpha/beta family hydrolase [Baekduia sp.]
PDDVLEIDTPYGLARAHVRHADDPVAALLLGHGAGGSIEAPDLVAATGAALDAHVTVARIVQPYRVAGRRSAAPAKQLDAAWLAVHAVLSGGVLSGLPTLSGGRSSGARVACRTAAETGALGVLCLAFPLHPPQRNPDAEVKTRLPELDAVKVPVLVVQGRTDRFGMPPAKRGRRKVVEVTGDHALKADVPAVRAAVAAWLPGVLAGG